MNVKLAAGLRAPGEADQVVRGLGNRLAVVHQINQTKPTSSASRELHTKTAGKTFGQQWRTIGGAGGKLLYARSTFDYTVHGHIIVSNSNKKMLNRKRGT